MKEDKKIREYLIKLLDWEGAHMNFKNAVADFPEKFMNIKPPHVVYTPWHLIEHIHLTQEDILEFIINPKYKEPKWPDNYWPGRSEKADKKKWDQTIKNYYHELKSLQEIVKDPKTDLFNPIPWGDGQTIFREIILVSDHTSYHVGELGIIRQILGAWPKGRKQ
jgi:hypothetical protein